MSSDSGGDENVGCAIVILALVIAAIFFNGEPDLVDALIFKMTGVDTSEVVDDSQD